MEPRFLKADLGVVVQTISHIFVQSIGSEGFACFGVRFQTPLSCAFTGGLQTLEGGLGGIFERQCVCNRGIFLTAADHDSHRKNTKNRCAYKSEYKNRQYTVARGRWFFRGVLAHDVFIV